MPNLSSTEVRQVTPVQLSITISNVMVTILKNQSVFSRQETVKQEEETLFEQEMLEELEERR